MTRRIVVLSGRVASGKSSLAEALVYTYGAVRLSTRELLLKEAERLGVTLKNERRDLQEFGSKRDIDSDGRWVVDALLPLLASHDSDQVFVVDSVRLAEQLDALRTEFGRTVVHVHLTAFEDELARRYVARSDAIDAGSSYAKAAADLTERQVESLASLADLHVNTSISQAADVLVRCAAKIGLLPSLDVPLVDVLVGGQYGSEGKGNLAFYLAPEYDLLLRVGGPNAGHKVPTNPVMTHRSLPSGALANQSAPLLIGAGAVISPEVLRREIVAGNISEDRIHIDPQAMVITRQDVRAERDLKNAIGSTGQGVGAASARKIEGRSKKLLRLARDTPALRRFVREPIVHMLEDAFQGGKRVLLEGTQGAGLSLHHGQYPFVTSRDTTAAGCLSEAGIGMNRVRRVVMVVRSFPIRVQGPSGPMGLEVDWEKVAARSGMSASELLEAEKSSVQRKLRRVAEFDWTALRASAQLNTPTDIALTFADYMSAENSKAYRFDQLQVQTREFIEEIEGVASAPVSMIAGRFTARSVIDRRRWRGHVNYDAVTGSGARP
jgi:adenylosuccinate synthase